MARQSLHSLFALLVTGDTPRYNPLASETGMKLCIAAGTDSAHIMSLARWLLPSKPDARQWQLQDLWSGKTRSLTFLLVWSTTTNLKIGVVHKENPAGRAITKLLASLCLGNEHSRLFVRSVGREEAAANTASTQYDLAMQQCAAAIPKAKVVIATTGLVWEQKAHMDFSFNKQILPQTGQECQECASGA